ncbi:MAG: N-6 DNA methylase [Methanoregula sp.]|nr:N-6 DNA methylase [Methanoregula sp.]
MAVPETIQPLVDKYTFHRDAYIRGQEKYNETQLRQDFTDPFFHALGWDVNNNKGHSEAYREVLHEEPIRIRGTTYFFDYTFRIGGIRKFIVETKKPSVRIKDDADSALQLRRYAWNAKLPLSILTNFEEFAVYDCTIKPGNGDNAAKGRIEYFTYREIPEKWEYLVSVFSQESILKGSFDKYAGSHKGKKGTATVDDDILTEIESWRDALAKNLALRNPALSVDELNTVVQRTIDRIIFLRICEDRGIEEYATLHKLLEGEQVYARLCEHFREADAKYNSGLFHFEKEPDWDEMPDTLSLSLTIDDKVLKGIIKRLYYPETPYLFSVIPPEILGHVYEQFLGKVIRLTDGHQAKVEYKPEVKKAGGVFYTPQYIVEYIVKHTVGELTKDKTPRDVAKLRVLDPACGSGSFLIGAYQFLLDWHRDWYIENLVPVFIDKRSVTDPAVLALLPEAAPRGKKKLSQVDLPIYKAGTSGDATRTRSDWRLTTVEKKRILLNNIFGVDIDTQAVEVTKLSLLLKVLEEENEENIDKQLKLFAERALPSLHQNIKCGNSLIGWDILTPEMPGEEVKRINPFDWSKEFAPAMAAGGFDAVIGNPPYIQSREGRVDELSKEYFENRYSTVEYQINTYGLFVEKGIKLLKINGLFGMIIPNYWLSTKYDNKLRNFVIIENNVNEILNVYKVFENATVDTLILVLEKAVKIVFPKEVRICCINRMFKTINERLHAIINETFSFDTNYLITSSDQIISISFQNPLKLEGQDFLKNFFNFKFGMKPYEEGKGVPHQTKNMMKNKIFDAEKKLDDTYKPLLRARNIKRYYYKWENDWIKYGVNLAAPRNHDIFVGSRILVQRIVSKDRLDVTFIDEEYICNTDVISLLPKNIERPDILFFLGILASNTCGAYIKSKNVNLDRAAFPKINTNTLEEFPIPKFDPNNPADKAHHDRMVALVTQMLELNKKLQDATLDHEKTLLSRQVEATDAAIDKLVYDLYGLTEEEIAIVEGSSH